jgi:hypothetical protein
VQKSAVGGEVFVDDGLIAQILMSILSAHTPRTLVLLTGDGNDNHGRASFFTTVTTALQHNWKVEVWAWRSSVSKRYKDLELSYADTGRYQLNYLDSWRDEVRSSSPALSRAVTPCFFYSRIL